MLTAMNKYEMKQNKSESYDSCKADDSYMSLIIIFTACCGLIVGVVVTAIMSIMMIIIIIR